MTFNIWRWSELRIVALAGAGPGGLLISIDGGSFSSMRTASARGLEAFRPLTAPDAGDLDVR